MSETHAAYYALDNLPNKVLAAEYQMVFPDEKPKVVGLNPTPATNKIDDLCEPLKLCN
jgi:hypothetical protein